MGYRAVVLGASGFAGGELLRLLSRHPGIEVVAAAASTRTGRPVDELYPWLADRRMVFVAVDEALAADADMVFSSLPHGESMRLFGAAPGSGPSRLVVDLAGDFRLHDPEARAAWYGASPVQAGLGSWVYGLTEWHRDEIAASNRVADPGCYAAAALLCLAPLVAAGAVRPDPIHIDGLSGVSGAGRAGGAHGEQFGYASANENLRPYAPTGHRHIGEIEQELGALAGTEVTVSFVPHLVPMTRGLAVTCTAQAEAGATTADLSATLAERYRDEAFVRALDGGRLPESRRVAGTNVAEVAAQVDERTGRALVFGAIDNLGKGAAGQAVQNANLMLGFGEDTALDVAALVP